MISVIIPTYNKGPEALFPCLESLQRETTREDVEFITVMNGSTPEMIDYCQRMTDPRFNYMYYKDPLGYTKATNFGIQQALTNNPDYIILLNDDTEIIKLNENQPPNLWIDMLLEPFKQDPLVGMTGPMLVHCPDADRDFLIGFCVCVKADMFRKYGLLDEVFNPGFGEDSDFCARIEDAGWKIAQVPYQSESYYAPNFMTGGFPIYHKGEVTFKDVEGGDELLAKNRKILQDRYRKELPDGWFGDADIASYRSIISNLPDNSRILEIGTWKGRSLCSIAHIILRKNIQVYTIDTYKGTMDNDFEAAAHAEAKVIDIGDVFADNIERFGITKNVTMTRGDSQDRAIVELFNDECFDEIMIDGNHGLDAVRADLKNWYPKLKKGGVMCGHDAGWVPIRQALEEKFGTNWDTNWGDIWLLNKPRVFDCFTFYNELDLLEARFNMLDDVVDYFVISEAAFKHNGQPKPYNFDKDDERWAQWKDKIKVIRVDKFPDGDAWTRERFQRDALKQAWEGLNNNDIIMVSDLDEIPNPKSIHYYSSMVWDFSEFSMDMYYYDVHHKSTHLWNWSKILPYRTAKDKSPCEIRYTNCQFSLINGGWHFSYFGGIDKVIEKIDAFAHQEYNTDRMKDRLRVSQCIRNNEDLFERPDETWFSSYPAQDTLPSYIVDHLDKYSLYEDGIAGYVKPVLEHPPVIIEDKPPEFLQNFTLQDAQKVLANAMGNQVRDVVDTAWGIAEDEVPYEIVEEAQYFGDTKPLTVTAEISTRNRYYSTLPMCLMAIAMQTRVPEKLYIFDDSDKPITLTDDPLYQYIFGVFDLKGIDWKIWFGKKEGQVSNHRGCLEMADTDLVYRIDDDNILEPYALEMLLQEMKDGVGAVGGNIWFPNRPVEDKPDYYKNELYPSVQFNAAEWYKWKDTAPIEVQHLNNTFLYRVEAARKAGGYPDGLSKVGHREETIFTHRIYRTGYKLILTPKARAYHFRYHEGGIRQETSAALWDSDEKVFQNIYAQEWGYGEGAKELRVFLNVGLGDTLMWYSLLPEIRAKYPDKKIVVSCVFPEVFEDESDLELISISDGHLRWGDNLDQYNPYVYYERHGMTGSFLESYRRMYAL